MTSFNKSEQFEELSGRENQYGLYVSDRWTPNEKLTLNMGVRYEYYPLMARENRGIELLDVPTYTVRLGGVGNNPKDLGIKVSKTLFAPRVGASYRIDDRTVLRGGYGKTFDPFPITRPMRGRFPLTIAHSDSGAEHIHAVWEPGDRHYIGAQSQRHPQHRHGGAPARCRHDDARPEQLRSRRDPVL